MKQNLILVVILLATLLMVNATPHQLRKRATVFGPCPADPTATAPPGDLTVTLSPDPPVAGQDCVFTVGATFPVDTPDQLIIADAPDTSTDPANQSTDVEVASPIDICTSAGVTCPTSALSMSVTVPISATATGTFDLAVLIVDATNTTLGCAVATVTV